MTAKLGKFIANPYSALDAEGRPSGLFPVDTHPSIAHGRRLYVGGDIDPKRTVILQKENKARGIAGRQRTIAKFVSEAQSLPITPHHAFGVRSGDLIPADLETALACGLSQKDFKPPEAALAEARDAAIKRWEAQYGEPPKLIDEDPEAAGEQETEKRRRPAGAGAREAIPEASGRAADQMRSERPTDEQAGRTTAPTARKERG